MLGKPGVIHPQNGPPKYDKKDVGREDHVVCSHIIYVLQMLSYLGYCPLGYYEKRFSKFRFEIFSVVTLRTFVPAAWMTITWIIFYLDYAQLNPIPGIELTARIKTVQTIIANSKKINATTIATLGSIITVAMLTICMSRLHGLLCGWQKARCLEKYLNTWDLFHQEFDRTFIMYLKDDKSRCQLGRKIPRWMIHSWYFLPMIVPVLMNISLFRFSSASVNITRILLSLTWMLGFIPVELLEDVKTILLFGSVSKAYRMINSGVEFTATWQSLDENTVKSWRDVVTIVRDQGALLNKYTTPRHSFMVAETILMATITAYVLLNMDWTESETIPFAILWGSLALLFICRIMVKSAFAERITKAEQRLATTIAMVNAKERDTSTLIQLKFTHDLLANKPAQVELGNYLVFNRRVVLVIFNQVVTYLIVLLQFSQK